MCVFSVVITFPSPTLCVPDRKKTRPRYPCVSPIVGAAPKQPSLTTYSFGEGKRQGRHTEGGIKKFQQLHNIPVVGRTGQTKVLLAPAIKQRWNQIKLDSTHTPIRRSFVRSFAEPFRPVYPWPPGPDPTPFFTVYH